tara:strand:- start:9 stop:407 length:399 start_codon:yes stop_codon:yes gene_type:complete
MSKRLNQALYLSLMILVIFGLWGALQVSFDTLTTKAPCPDVGGVPICYLVTVGYLSMFLSVLFSASKRANSLFYLGWGLVLIIALVGVITEIVLGDICPVNEQGIPLCYLSLALCLLIVSLYFIKSKLQNRK